MAERTPVELTARQIALIARALRGWTAPEHEDERLDLAAELDNARRRWARQRRTIRDPNPHCARVGCWLEQMRDDRMTTDHKEITR